MYAHREGNVRMYSTYVHVYVSTSLHTYIHTTYIYRYIAIHASHMPVTCQSHASCIRNTVVRGIHHTPAASPRHTCQVELLRWSTHGRSGPQVAMSYTCSGFRSCLNLLKNLTPWLSPLRELTRATQGFWRALLSQGYA